MSSILIPSLLAFLVGAILVALISWRMMHRQQARTAEKDAELQQARVAETEARVQLQAATASQQQLEQRLSEATQMSDSLRSEISVYREEISHLKTTLAEQQKQGEEKLQLLEKAKQQLNIEFKNIANEIFDAKQKSFKEQSQMQLDGLLKPLGERIKDFEKRVEDTYAAESRERFSLVKEVKNLQDLNSRISKDAINLTNALKGESKTQGTWGEVILERVLEKSGLAKGREYEVQVSAKSGDGKRQQPDVVVHLPEGKDIIIDSKVSLTAYERYCSSDEPEQKAQAIKEHVQSLRQHIKQLSDKDYQNLVDIRTLDFVLLFVPIEAAFSLALEHDTELFLSTFDKNIVLVTPSTLLAMLRTIQTIWRHEQQNQNAEEIARRAGALYDKFVGFVDDLQDIGNKITSLQTSYDKAHNKLASGKGNLVTRAENMRELGAKTSKNLPTSLVEIPRLEGKNTP